MILAGAEFISEVLQLTISHCFVLAILAGWRIHMSELLRQDWALIPGRTGYSPHCGLLMKFCVPSKFGAFPWHSMLIASPPIQGLALTFFSPLCSCLAMSPTVVLALGTQHLVAHVAWAWPWPKPLLFPWGDRR